MDRLDTRSLLELAVKSADNMILTAKKLEKDELTANKANALVNSYRSAGQLYLEVVKAVEGSSVIVLQDNRTPTELSQADRERLDRISDLLSGKSGKRKSRKKQEG